MDKNKSVTVVGLQDATDIARTISNKTSQSIIDYVKENKGVTATEIAKALKLPASTVHYNISALVKAKILDDSSFHYSSKGKQVSHYEVSEQVIVIVPDSSNPSIGTQLKVLLPGVLGVAVVAGAWFASKAFSSLGASGSYTMDESMNALQDEVVLQAAPMVARTVVPSPEPNTQLLFWGGILVGIAAIVIGVLGYYYLIKKRK